MTRYARHQKSHVEASGFKPRRLDPYDKRKEKQNLPERQDIAKRVCFKCREPGHSVKNCPKKDESDVNICFVCGENDHSAKTCPEARGKKKIEYRFASCFICNEIGHLSGQCPKNDKGVYVNGGCCRFCGSKSHLAKDCKPMSNDEYSIGLVDAAQGGDDDDAHLALRKMGEEKKQVKENKKTKKIVKF
ncbi:hypothetical protein O9G_003705 [Rozella allomycis CSF55]|uniref:CCHC-type domain-containing protein n=1 Tax=Rozella allomycis (strain CSF55) TaxID=988480 RepID=A0A075AWN3_ROZAC|nr:hypothetical protein O9G_003705 [Rozella allomycis CSF55]|eukprot:EPZ32974.1 hypothetical protein O9G_003705 [Rozella allomycis CSF55]